jgi:hypothetical protein
MLSVLVVALAGAIAVADPSAPGPTPSIPSTAHLVLDAPARRVRAPDPRLHSLLTLGFHRSPTFAALLTALNQSDVIVYIEAVMTLPKETMGRLSLVPRVGGAGTKERYLRVQIRADLPRKEAIALIAHEMRHALEIAESAEVRDPGGMIKLYERIGHTSSGEHAYETIAAQDTGRQVRKELAGLM